MEWFAKYIIPAKVPSPRVYAMQYFPSLGSTQMGCTSSPVARLNILETKKTRVYCRVLQRWNVCALTEACQRVIVGLYTSDPRVCFAIQFKSLLSIPGIRHIIRSGICLARYKSWMTNSLALAPSVRWTTCIGMWYSSFQPKCLFSIPSLWFMGYVLCKGLFRETPWGFLTIIILNHLDAFIEYLGCNMLLSLAWGMGFALEHSSICL